MPRVRRRRTSKFQPDRQVRILREYTRADDGEFAWEAVSQVYAQRVDKRGSARDEGDAEEYEKTVQYVVPRTIRVSPAADAPGQDPSGPEAFGEREFGELPLGGRGPAATDRYLARGADVRVGDGVQDLAVHGRPIFLVVDIFQLVDRRRDVLTCRRSDRQGAVYGD